MLTKKQKELFDYLKEYISNNQISPSFEEMKEAVNLKSKSGFWISITKPPENLDFILSCILDNLFGALSAEITT